MKCRRCHNDVERTDLYCRYCGNQLFKVQKREVTVPKARSNKDGSYSGQIMVRGERYTVKGDSYEEYTIKAKALRLSLLTIEKAPPKVTLGDAISQYIESNSNILSPSTIRGYRNILKNRFTGYMYLPYRDINYQEMVNSERCSPKTLANAFALVKTSLQAGGFQVPDVNLPKVITPDLQFLDYTQVKRFLTAIHGKSGELAAILALHSLRMSEILAITTDDVVDNKLVVSKALVRNSDNIYVEKTTKTAKSTRTIPIMIDRLYELLPISGRLVTTTPVGIERQIRRACEDAQVPYVGCHGLRRTFASLAYHLKWDERSIMLIGGWSNMQTVHRVYIKLSQQDVIDNATNMYNFYQITDRGSNQLGQKDC